MSTAFTNAAWIGYALTGRPDFLNYLQRGDVTWRQLWDFYRETPADTDAMVRLMGLFHVFMSHDYDREGCSPDPEGKVYPELRKWARFVVDCRDIIPEDKLRDSLAGLLGQSLVSPLYYEAAFSAYLEADLDWHAELGPVDPAALGELVQRRIPNLPDRRLSIRLPETSGYRRLQGRPYWQETVAAVVERHYVPWNRAYALALGEDAAEWRDEGGEGGEGGVG